MQIAYEEGGKLGLRHHGTVNQRDKLAGSLVALMPGRENSSSGCGAGRCVCSVALSAFRSAATRAR